jgi:hypothetical protein
MAGKNKKIRRKRMMRDFASYHEPLITASRYVKRETEGIFQEIYMDVKEYWDIGGATVCVYVMHNGKMYRSYDKWFSKKVFDSMYKRGISPELYCRAVLEAEVFNLHAKIFVKEDIGPVFFSSVNIKK